MKPEDLIEGGVIRDSDLEGEPPGAPAEVGPFGRYVLLEELGRGGAAIVYRAIDPLLNRELALKKLRFGDRELEARFLREAELLARLSHSGIVPLFDFGKEGDAHYYTMPLAGGPSLDRWIQERRPGATEAARMARQVAEALAHAHERGVLHRDVKPANILLSGEGAPLLADFGLGRFEESGPDPGRVTETGEVMGTPSYMAPELATRDLKRADARCDVYSLGATLYELLTGAPPFVGASALEILKKSATEEPIPPRRRTPETPADLEIICLKALEKDPARRYATVREMGDDLGRFLAGEPIRAHRATVLYRVRRFVGRRRAIMSVALAGLVIALGVGAYYVAREDKAAALQLLVSNLLREAEVPRQALEELLRDHPEDHPAVRHQLGLALALIDQALSADPDNANAYFQKGKVHALVFQKDEARRNYDLAVQKGRLARAHLERAILDSQDLFLSRYQRRGQGGRDLIEGIRRDLDAYQALTRDRKDFDFAQALLEMSSLSRDGFVNAARLLEGYSAVSRDWRAYYWKGIAEMESKDAEKARASFETALRSRQKTRISAMMLDRLGGLDYVLKGPAEAKRRFREAVDLNPRVPSTKANLASTHFELGELDDAIHWSEEALLLDRASVMAHAIRGQAYVRKHQNEVRDGRKPDRKLLEAARESLAASKDSFPAASPQAGLLRKAWDYVGKHLDY